MKPSNKARSSICFSYMLENKGIRRKIYDWGKENSNLKTKQWCSITNYPNGWNDVLLNILLWPLRSVLWACSYLLKQLNRKEQQYLPQCFLNIHLVQYKWQHKSQHSRINFYLYFSFQAFCQKNSLIVATHTLKWSFEMAWII